MSDGPEIGGSWWEEAKCGASESALAHKQAGGAAGAVGAMVEARRELRPALQQGSAACGGRLRCAFQKPV